MISSRLSNRLVFFLSLLGLAVSYFLFYEYNLSGGSMICPLGDGCDIVRNSSYSRFLGISIPFLGIVFYSFMAILSVVHSHKSTAKLIANLKLLSSFAAVGFGIYLTYLEAFIIKAFCFWCVISFIISLAILLLVAGQSIKHADEHRN